MKATLMIKRTDLRSAVSRLMPAISSKVLPVLGHIQMHLDAVANLIHLSSTDLEIRIGASLSAKIQVNDGESKPCLIRAQTFSDLLGMMESDEVRLEIDETQLLLRTGSTKTLLSLFPEDSFPPEFTLATNASLFSLSTQSLKEALQRVITAASTDYSRPALNSILFALTDNKLHLVAADGFRLATDMVQAESTVSEEKNYLLPMKMVQKLLRILPDEDSVLAVQADERRILFCWGENRFWASLMEAQFPDWRQVVFMADGHTLPGDAKPFPREAMQMAVKRADIFAREGGVPHLIHFKPSDMGMRISGEGIQTGKSEEEIECHIQIPFALNGLYVLQALSGMERARPEIYLSGSDKPIIFTEEDFIYVVMPLYLPKEEEVPVAEAVEVEVEAVPV